MAGILRSHAGMEDQAMSQRVVLAASVVVTLLVVVLTWSMSRKSSLSSETLAPSVTDARELDAEPQWQAALQARDREIEELRGEVKRLEALLDQQRAVAKAGNEAPLAEPAPVDPQA